VLTPRDALVLAVTAVASVASIASDTYVAGQSFLEDIVLEGTVVVAYDVTIGRQTLVSSFSELDSNFGVSIFAETDADSADALEDVTATLFAVDDDAARGDALNVGSAGDVLVEDEVFTRHVASPAISSTAPPLLALDDSSSRSRRPKVSSAWQT
jgi:hypothetical protein